MTAPVVATVTYAGTVLAGDQIASSPWDCVGCLFPDQGSPATKPQFELDVLQPVNVDGARYRVGGAHFPPFRMVTIMASDNFPTAASVAREIELTKGDNITIELLSTGRTETCVVLSVRSVPNASRVLNAASSVGFSGTISTDTAASIDTFWTLQVVPA